MNRLDYVISSALAERAFPGAVIRASENGRLAVEKAYGLCGYDTGPSVSVSTVYDLASLTKPLATVPGIMVLLKQGIMSFESNLNELLPDHSWGEKGDVTLVQLLTHSSGLPDHRPYYKILSTLPLEDRLGRLRQMLVEEALLDPPGLTVRYSDLGYMILCWIIERHSGVSMGNFISDNVFSPTGIQELSYFQDSMMPSFKGRVAPTEYCCWRGKMLCGEVHDDNAWVLGGVGGHAGLFGTVEAVDRLVCLWYMNEPHPLSGLSTKQHSLFLDPWLNTGRSPGFDMPSGQVSSAGRYFPRSSVGHLGFTGTSFWVDRKAGRVVTLLTNRVHPSRENLKIRQYRPMIYDALMEDLGWDHHKS